MIVKKPKTEMLAACEEARQYFEENMIMFMIGFVEDGIKTTMVDDVGDIFLKKSNGVKVNLSETFRGVFPYFKRLTDVMEFNPEGYFDPEGLPESETSRIISNLVEMANAKEIPFAIYVIDFSSKDFKGLLNWCDVDLPEETFGEYGSSLYFTKYVTEPLISVMDEWSVR